MNELYNCKVEYVLFVDLISTEKYIFIGLLLLLMLAWGFMKLIIGQDSEARFSQDFEVWFWEGLTFSAGPRAGHSWGEANSREIEKMKDKTNKTNQVIQV